MKDQQVNERIFTAKRFGGLFFLQTYQYLKYNIIMGH